MVDFGGPLNFIHLCFVVMLMRCHRNLTLYLYQLTYGKICFNTHNFTSSCRTYGCCSRRTYFTRSRWHQKWVEKCISCLVLQNKWGQHKEAYSNSTQYVAYYSAGQKYQCRLTESSASGALRGCSHLKAQLGRFHFRAHSHGF